MEFCRPTGERCRSRARPAKDHATALGNVQLVRHPRPVHPVRVLPAVDHAELAELTTLRHRRYGSDRRRHAARMAAHQLDAVSLSCLIHRLRLLDRDCEGFEDDDVLSVLRRDNRVLGVQVVGRGDPDDVDVGTDEAPPATPTAMPTRKTGWPVLPLDSPGLTRGGGSARSPRPAPRPRHLLWQRKARSARALLVDRAVFPREPEPIAPLSRRLLLRALRLTQFGSSDSVGTWTETFFAGSRNVFIGSPPSSTIFICSRSRRRYRMIPLSDSPRCSVQRGVMAPWLAHA